jgi:formamidopyrimidine-DNA glycosylase
MHLGMSGSLRLVPAPRRRGRNTTISTSSSAPRPALRLRDPRRFGAVLWLEGDAAAHPLLAPLGIEPLTDAFDGAWLHAATRGRERRSSCS